MAFFRRSPTAASVARAQAEAIARFWAWWAAEGAALTAGAIDDRAPARSAPAISARVEAIHADLAWELGPGVDGARHVLVVTSEGNPDLRPVARRWCRAAPAPDVTWSYSDTRLPEPDPTGTVLVLGDATIDVASALARAHVSGTAVDVSLYHPAFAGLPEGARTSATYLLLDSVLGEAAVETWLGGVGTSTEPPIDPVPLVGLRAVIDELNTRFTDADGSPHWVLMEGSGADGSPALASARIPLRAGSAPHLDTHVAVAVPYADRTETGLPGPGSLQSLRDFEYHVGERLEDGGQVVAHETHGGVRILHAYVDGTTPAVEQLRAAVTGWDQGPVTIGVTLDPGWAEVSHLRG